VCGISSASVAEPLGILHARSLRGKMWGTFWLGNWFRPEVFMRYLLLLPLLLASVTWASVAGPRNDTTSPEDAQASARETGQNQYAGC
jgi:hypothetical protein